MGIVIGEPDYPWPMSRNCIWPQIIPRLKRGEKWGEEEEVASAARSPTPRSTPVTKWRDASFTSSSDLCSLHTPLPRVTCVWLLSPSGLKANEVKGKVKPADSGTAGCLSRVLKRILGFYFFIFSFYKHLWALTVWHASETLGFISELNGRRFLSPVSLPSPGELGLSTMTR